MKSGSHERLRNWKPIWKEQVRIARYCLSGRRPWSVGYTEYKLRILNQLCRDQELLGCFLSAEELPPKYGFRFDERVIEYPWVLSRLHRESRRLLDAGAAFNYPYLVKMTHLRDKAIVIYHLAPEGPTIGNHVSYVYGDLRGIAFQSECFDEIVCISTLEHVGMDATRFYTDKSRYCDNRPEDYRHVIREFKRLLKPKGRLFVTVPYGRYQNLGWLQQFDRSKIESVLDEFGGSLGRISYYKYFETGWQIATVGECDDCEYFDIHTGRPYERDYAAAARAVACMELVKH